MSSPQPHGAFAKAYVVLTTADPADKCRAAAHLAAEWERDALIGTPLSAEEKHHAERPARPDAPTLVPPAEVPRRRLGSVEGRKALLHAVAHIEFNAIDLAADMICRFGDDPSLLLSATEGHTPEQQQRAFIADWISVCADEARHFTLIRDRLKTLDTDYGTHVAHDGLWEAALSTRHDIAARLAIAPMVLEARGLDVTPSMIKKLIGAGDTESASILQIIYDDEIGHVAAGTHWFGVIAAIRGESDPHAYFHRLVREHFSGLLKPPFNTEGRSDAGLTPNFYVPLTSNVS